MAEHVPINWVIDGAIDSLDRLAETTKRSDAGPEETFRRLFESLNWAASIDLWFYEQGNSIDDPTLTGVRFARNRVHHQWGAALERFDWPGVPVTNRIGGPRIVGPPAGFWWRWVPADQLPAGNADPDAERAYTKRLAGNAAELTVQALKPVLESLRP